MNADVLKYKEEKLKKGASFLASMGWYYTRILCPICTGGVTEGRASFEC